MAKTVQASVKQVAFNCPHCDVLTSQSWFNLYGIRTNALPKIQTKQALDALRLINLDGTRKADVESAEKKLLGLPVLEAVSGHRADVGFGNTWASVCYVCKGISYWIGEKLIYPAQVAGSPPNEDLSADIKVDFEEARTILNASPRGAAALLRLCVQKLCKQLGESGTNIDADIASLVKKGLDPTIQRALDIVRVVGNEAVHPGSLDLKDDRDTALELFDLINIIAEQLISMPLRVKTTYEKIPEAKRKRIEERDKPKP